jgi:hypothetical protein
MVVFVIHQPTPQISMSALPERLKRQMFNEIGVPKWEAKPKV